MDYQQKSKKRINLEENVTVAFGQNNTGQNSQRKRELEENVTVAFDQNQGSGQSKRGSQGRRNSQSSRESHSERRVCQPGEDNVTIPMRGKKEEYSPSKKGRNLENNHTVPMGHMPPSRSRMENNVTIPVGRHTQEENVTMRLSDADVRDDLSQKMAGAFQKSVERRKGLDEEQLTGRGVLDPVDIVNMDTRASAAKARQFSGARVLAGTAVSMKESVSKTVPDLKSERVTVSRALHIHKPVGWLVCIEGPEIGNTFPLKSGINVIGASRTCDVCLSSANRVSRNLTINLEYKPEGRMFQVYRGAIMPGETGRPVYLNKRILLMPAEMRKNDKLHLGICTLMLIPCCDEKFDWEEV